MIDIDKELNKIIFSYSLDRYYPHYRNMCETEKILRNIIGDIKQQNSKAIFVGNDAVEVAFIRSISRDCANTQFQLYRQNETTVLETVDWKQYDVVYLVSYYGAEYIERWFRIHRIHYEWIYDIFEYNGIFCQHPFLFLGKENLMPMIDEEENFRHNPYTGAIQCELYCQQSKYYHTKNQRVKQIALEKCLFLTLYMRNFVMAKEYATLLMEKDEKYEHAWTEIQELLSHIKNIVRNRKTEDIIVYWLDAIPYGDENNMPYLRHIMKKSIVFENAFTYMPYTHPVLRELFLGKKELDDKTYRIKMITKENSSLIQFLEKQGYDVKIISGYFNDCFPSQYQPDQFIVGGFEAASLKLWDMISNMLKQSQKTLWIVHAMDAHAPELSCRMSDDNYKNNQIRYRLAQHELDEQLAFYDDFVNEKTYKIYMSDHGREAIYRHHILFNIYHKSWKPKRIESLFSLLDFNVILKQIILSGHIQEKEFCREYVEIGNLDRYNRRNIQSIIQNKTPLSMFLFGYKGIIDKEYIYICYRTGKEWLHKRSESLLCEPILFYDCAQDICEAQLLPRYRKLGVEYPKDIMEDKQFRFSRYLYVLYDNILKHNNMFERIDTINQILGRYPNRSVAIKTGGVTSAKLYYILSEENKKKIWGFIDTDRECLCSKLQLPVIHSDEVNLHSNSIKAILLPSYVYLEMFRKESTAWSESIDILDIYASFDGKGITCREDFCKMRGTDKDYNVGFPFEEM